MSYFYDNSPQSVYILTKSRSKVNTVVEPHSVLVLGQVNEKISKKYETGNYSKEFQDIIQKLSTGLSNLGDLMLVIGLAKPT